MDFAPSRKWKVFYGPSVHQDIGYTDYQAKVAEIHARNVDRLLEVYRRHPDYRYNLDGSWLVEQWLPTRAPESVRRFAEEARAGRIAVNGFYGNFWTEALSLEELYRGLYFSKHLEKELGVPFDTAWATDVPSYSWSVALDAGGGRDPLLCRRGQSNPRALAWVRTLARSFALLVGRS